MYFNRPRDIVTAMLGITPNEIVLLLTLAVAVSFIVVVSVLALWLLR